MSLFLICVFWLVAVFRLIFLQTAVWQTKEYRWDRMREYLRLGSTKRMLLSPVELVKWLLLFLFITGNALFGFYLWFVFAIYLLDFMILVKEIRQRAVARPALTVKALAIILVAILVIFVLVIIAEINQLFSAGVLVTLDRFVAPLIAVFVFIFFPLSRFFISRKIRKARKMRSGFRQITAIGITGSYGKSSTKNILATLLGGEALLVTPGNTNTEIGVAQFMLKNLDAKIRYFVAEMGAYRTGEINNLAKLVQPKIGILTAVGNQHLGLFGSHEKIRRAKYELIESLPPDGAGIFNADDPVCLELANQTKNCEVLTYGLSDEADLQAKIINVSENGIEVKVFGLVPETVLTVPVTGPHQLVNVLAGIVAAIVLGKNWTEIQSKIQLIKLEKQTMEKYATKTGALIIDDSYNANENGVIAALENLKNFSQSKKIVILTPMIELGADSAKAHRAVGKVVAKTATQAYYAGTDFRKELLAGAKNITADFNVKTGYSSDKILKEILPLLDQDTVVLLEGRVPKLIRESLRKI